MMRSRFCVPLCLIVLALAVSSAHAISFKEIHGSDIPAEQRAEVFLREWAVLGPFPIDETPKSGPVPASWSEDPFEVARVADLVSPVLGKSWARLAASDGKPVIDLASQLSPNENAAVYAGTYVFADRACERNLLTGSDDGIAVWLNGARLFAKHELRACKVDTDTIPVKLNRGANQLLAKITQGTDGWAFAARFDDNSGLSVSTAPDVSSAARLFAADDAARLKPRFIGGPYIQNMVAQSVTVMWYTDVPCRARLTVSDGRTTRTFSTRALKRVGEIEVSGLAPDTRYTYSVEVLNSLGQPGDRAAGEGWEFRTFPAEKRPVTFVAYGDTRSLPDRHAKVCDAIAAERPEFVLHTGDLVADGRNLASWVPEFFRPAGKLMRNVPMFACLGNHEGNSRYYFDFLSLPMGERYYSFDVLDMHFIALDSCIDFDRGSEQYKWLISDLEEHKDARWKFVFLHHPPYTSGNHGSVDENGVPKEKGIRTGRRLMPQLAAKYGITAVFSGHDHAYERSERDGTFYIVTGGGGAPNYGNPNARHNPYSKFFYSGLHYCLITVDGDRGSIVVKTPEGEVLDRFEL